MDLLTIREVLGWCAVLNMGILLWWWGFIVFGHDWVYRMHTKWLKVSVEEFDRVHYVGMMRFKLAIVFFNAVPYFALRIVG